MVAEVLGVSGEEGIPAGIEPFRFLRNEKGALVFVGVLEYHSEVV